MDDTTAEVVAEMIAAAIDRLGTNRASTPFGALEAHSMIVEASAEKIADALHDVAEAIRGA